jgi:N-methylhydantoinase A
MATRIGVDIGGTFTDLVVYDDRSGQVTVEKVATTPSAPEVGCVDALRRVATRPGMLESCEYFLHGTTVGLNALLERRGARVGLLCTEGFRDALEIRRGARPERQHSSHYEWRRVHSKHPIEKPPREGRSAARRRRISLAAGCSWSQT